MKIGVKQSALVVLLCALTTVASANDNLSDKVSTFFFSIFGISSASSQEVEENYYVASENNEVTLSQNTSGLPAYCEKRPEAAGCSQTQ